MHYSTSEKVQRRYRHIIELLTWPVRAELISSLVVVRSQVTQKHWIEVAEKPRSSRAFWWTAGLTAAASLLGTSGIAIYRSITTITESWPLGPEWLAWLALACFTLTATISIIIPLVIQWSEVFGKIFDKLLDNDRAGVALSALLVVTLTYGVISAMITIFSWAGWAIIPATTLIFVLIVTAIVLANHRDRTNANVLRKCLSADRQVQLGRRSVIAS